MVTEMETKTDKWRQTQRDGHRDEDMKIEMEKQMETVKWRQRDIDVDRDRK